MWRQYLIYIIAFTALILIITRLILLQVFDTDCFLLNYSNCKSNLSVVADKRQTELRSIKTQRGIIYDRNGEILAMSLPRQTLCVNAFMLNKLNKSQLNEYRKLFKIINITETKFKSIIKNNKTKRELYLKRKITNDKVIHINSLKLQYVYFIDEFHRVYLGNEYFSNVIGFTDIDDKGQEGIEYSKDSLLNSIKGLKKIRKDNLGRSIENIELIQEPTPGKDIYLSIDKRMQFIGYNILKKYTKKFNAESASLILVKNKTGEIISMVNYPSFDPSDRRQMTGIKIKNRAVTEIFEPGSTMKPFTILTALKSNKYDMKTLIDTSPGVLRIGKHEIKDYKNLGELNLEDIIEKSSNVGAAKISLSLNKKDIYNTLKNFQFGEDLYVGFPGEQPGNLKHYSLWDESQHASIGYGYGISSTLLQLTNAYTILANNGKHIQLTYEKHNNDQIFSDQLFNESNIKTLTNIMTSVVNKGTGKKASLTKYSVAGKTGTVRINIDGNYKTDKHLALFIGMAPASDPEYVLSVIMRSPNKGNASGGENAAPIFRDYMSHVLNLLKVYPDKK